ncbi:MAG: aspartate kinase [Oscillospiraceae bacterium]|nr:aspartate kinase [Oscillospiraceae bacterium]
MGLIVQKFGGSSVANAERVMNVAKIITDTYRDGNDVVVVVSAQGDTTDDLIEKAYEITDKPSKREMDMLLTSGEQISISLLAMAIEKLGCPAVSLLGWQAGFNTTSAYGIARIKSVKADRIRAEIDRHNIVVVAGFQGLNKYDDLTTLGRGGSDTSAVAIAAAMHADRCQIFTDVEGVFTADPRKVPNAKKLQEITYDEMLELATLGAQVLNNRSVEMAKKYNVKLEVLSSMKRVPGTIVKEVAKMEKMLIRGVTKDTDVARISVTKISNTPGIAFKLFSVLAKHKINVDIILQSVGRDNTKDITFTVSKGNAEEAVSCIADAFDISEDDIICDTNVAKVSIVGAGMESHPGTASKMFEALYEHDINIDMISTSEIKISVLINIDSADKAVSAIHKAFFPEE